MQLGVTHTLETAPAESLTSDHIGREWMRCDYKTERLERIVRGFGVTDAKGREIGGSVVIEHLTITPRANSESGRITKECGEWLIARPHAVRDGEWFGASQSDNRFTSREALDAYVAKYFADAEKRARKAAAKA